jgi:DNA-binding response OmpR family regulator
VSRILVVEDEARIAAFIEKGLRANGYTISVAESGEEALGMARIGDYDLVVLDLGLPGADGLEVLRRLRAGGARMPILVPRPATVSATRSRPSRAARTTT